jgi:hypothetical protein
MTFLLLAMLMVKHWIADFVLQFEYMIVQKDQYGARGGIEHAMLHGALTAVVVAVFVNNVPTAAMFGLIDSIVHYHIDYVKARWGTNNTSTQKFWIQLGADQLAHMIFYVWLAWILNPIF